ncbi:VUT family protein [Burkholderia contaminans]|uniref:VUT family protein n=1 Tax=Burkholderia contaminans TaxID=488447 RepID=UPI001CF204DD|nr:VUT family protein [Burkholderia contaminans]MCA7888895.1 VUT family protein [Burkholderia contaminans]
MSIANNIPTCQVEAILPKDGERHQAVARVRVNDTGVLMKLPVGELLAANWIGKFSVNDVALLATVNANDVRIRNVTVQKPHFPYAIIYLTALFSVMLVTTNLIGDSISTLSFSFLPGYEILFPTALVVFPLTYCFGACITEAYGFVVSRHVIWGAFLVNVVVVAIIISLEKAGLLGGSILGVSQQMMRALGASAVGYFAGELSNSLVVSRLKIALKGRKLILRFIAANAVGAVLDSVLFGTLLFYGTVSHDVLLKIIVAQITIKMLYEMVFSVLFSRIVVWIKSRDGVDHYDYKVSFIGG